MTKHAKPSPSGLRPHSLVGQRVDERFEITSLIEANAYSAIYMATQQPLDRVVALKVIELERLGQQEVNRLLDEAKLLSAMTHPNLVRVHDFGQDKTHKIVFLAMEYVQGVSLRDLLSQDHRLDVALALELAHQLLGALIELHTQDLAHLNLNPKDILVVPMSDGSPQLRLVGLGGLNKHEHTLPEPAYRAPEQLQHQPSNASADLYTVGLLLYEMLCGYNPFYASSYQQIVDNQLNTPATPLSDLLSHDALPDGVELVVMKLLAKDLQWRLAPALNARQRVEELQDQHRMPRVRLGTQEDELLARFARWRKPTSDAARKALSAPSGAAPTPEPKPSKTRRNTPRFVNAEELKPSTPPALPTPKAQPEEVKPKPTLLLHNPPAPAQEAKPAATPATKATKPKPTPKLATKAEPKEELKASPQPEALVAAPEPIEPVIAPQAALEPPETKAEEPPKTQPELIIEEPPAPEAPPEATPAPKAELAPEPQPAPAPALARSPEQAPTPEPTPQSTPALAPEAAPEPAPAPAPEAKVIIAQEPAPSPAPVKDEDAFFEAPVEPAFDAEHIFVDEDYKEKGSRGMLIPVSIVLVLLVGGAIAMLVMSDIGKPKPEAQRDERGWSPTPTAKLTKPTPDTPPNPTPEAPTEVAPDAAPAPPQDAEPALSREEQIKALAPQDEEETPPEAPSEPEKALVAAPTVAQPSVKAPTPQPASEQPSKTPPAAPSAQTKPSLAPTASTAPAEKPAATDAKVAPEATPQAPVEDTNKSPKVKKAPKKKTAPVDKKLKKNLDWLKRR